ncbi:MAG TPA: hypothetical protein VJO33_11135 [Gemmatimonadaceae bacterium]|nr:hypothetical protein [Gemmatimonadaceae bacterium]
MKEVTLATRDALEHARAARQMVLLKREAIDAPRVDGFPLAIGSELVLLAVVDDWRFDGYAIVRLADVTEVRSNEYERFTERVLEREGELTHLVPPAPAVPVTAWSDVFEALRASGRYVLVHEEEYEEEPMSLGPVVAVHSDTMLLHYVGATAEWDAEPSEIAFQDVTRVQFGDYYSTVFARYAETTRPEA